MTGGIAWRDIAWRSPDGLLLHARDYGDEASPFTPVLCLSGLTRNARDFHALAARIAPRRRVLCPDYRGRGRSEWAADWSTYRPDVELADALALLDLLGIERAIVVGTSRGGLIAMLMAATCRERVAAVYLNDIGPVLEREGLLRILTYLGKPVDFAGWAEAVSALKATNAGFEGLSEEDWLAYARRLFRDDGGIPRLDYDPALRNAFLPETDIRAGNIPEMWEAFAAFEGLPVTVVRGANSDLLSARTLERMRERVSGLDAVTVPGRGHAPFLDEPECLAAFARLEQRAS